MPPKRKPAPRVLVLYNENPAWPEADKAWTARMVEHLSTALSAEGYHFQALKIFDHLNTLDAYDPREWLVWNWVEELGGQPWTDPIVAAEYERRGFAYTGSSAQTLAFSVDRMNIKQALQAASLPTLPARRFTDPAQAGEWDDFPAIVKGATQHGSFGIDGASIVHTSEQLARRTAFMRAEFGCDSLVERFLDTREFHVGVIGGNGTARALLPVEYDYTAFTDMHDRLFTYQWKYDENSYGYHALKLKCPALLPAGQQDRLQTVAVGAYQALGIHDYGRIDLRMWGDEPQVLDVNPNCDIDATSALMLGAKASGLTYSRVIGQIVEQAAERMPV